MSDALLALDIDEKMDWLSDKCVCDYDSGMCRYCSIRHALADLRSLAERIPRERDAERYRWLRANYMRPNGTLRVTFNRFIPRGTIRLLCLSLDGEIDAQMKGETLWPTTKQDYADDSDNGDFQRALASQAEGEKK